LRREASLNEASSFWRVAADAVLRPVAISDSTVAVSSASIGRRPALSSSFTGASGAVGAAGAAAAGAAAAGAAAAAASLASASSSPGASSSRAACSVSTRSNTRSAVCAPHSAAAAFGPPLRASVISAPIRPPRYVAPIRPRSSCSAVSCRRSSLPAARTPRTTSASSWPCSVATEPTISARSSGVIDQYA
jgi:hypothetical protein